MTARIDVAVNLLWLSPGRVGGSEEYLTRQLDGLDPGAGIVPTLFCQPTFAAAHPELSSKFETVPFSFDRDWRAVRIAAEHSWLALRSRGFDLVHHGGGTAPMSGRRSIVLTVHDLQYLEHPEYFGRARLAYLTRMMPPSVRRAGVVTTPSEFVKQTVVDSFGADPGRVMVVPHGVPDPSPIRPHEQAATLQRYGLVERPYVVYPAITHPHKGHDLLIDMLEHLDPSIALVLVGGVGAAEPALLRAIAASRHGDRVIRTGRVPAGDRDALVAGAAAMVFPSEYEGFGAPIVEAMCAGTPVVCGGAAAVREVAGDAAVVVVDRTPDAWAEGVTAAIRDRDVLVALGRRRRADFTIGASGRALASAYRLAVEQRAS